MKLSFWLPSALTLSGLKPQRRRCLSSVLLHGGKKWLTSKVTSKCWMSVATNVPRFVSHYLDELPQVTFMNLDVCRKVEQLHTEVSAMKSVLQLQAETSKRSSLCHSGRGCQQRLWLSSGDWECCIKRKATSVATFNCGRGYLSCYLGASHPDSSEWICFVRRSQQLTTEVAGA